MLPNQFALIALVFAALAAIAVLVVVRKNVELLRIKKQNYDWFKARYPDKVTPAGVKCMACDNANIRFRHLARKITFRVHICAKCGMTLYYTPVEKVLVM